MKTLRVRPSVRETREYISRPSVCQAVHLRSLTSVSLVMLASARWLHRATESSWPTEAFYGPLEKTFGSSPLPSSSSSVLLVVGWGWRVAVRS